MEPIVNLNFTLLQVGDNAVCMSIAQCLASYDFELTTLIFKENGTNVGLVLFTQEDLTDGSPSGMVEIESIKSADETRDRHIRAFRSSFCQPDQRFASTLLTALNQQLDFKKYHPDEDYQERLVKLKELGSLVIDQVVISRPEEYRAMRAATEEEDGYQAWFVKSPIVSSKEAVKGMRLYVVDSNFLMPTWTDVTLDYLHSDQNAESFMENYNQ